jgi:small subunit ribosomal protein S17
MSVDAAQASPNPGAPSALSPGRTAHGPKRVTGIVTSDKMQKTRAVKVQRLERHPKYGKFIRRHSTFKVHDEKEVAREGDTVLIEETRPLSKTKRWRLLEVLAKARTPGAVGITPPEAIGVPESPEVLSGEGGKAT